MKSRVNDGQCHLGSIKKLSRPLSIMSAARLGIRPRCMHVGKLSLAFRKLHAVLPKYLKYPCCSRKPTGTKRMLSVRQYKRYPHSHSPKSDRSKHEGSITNPQRPTSMNYNGAGGLEFGGGNTKVDPNVAAGQL